MKMFLLYSRLLREQYKWIEQCEAGISYNGPNGQAIREADYAELRRIEGILKPLQETMQRRRERAVSVANGD